MFENDLGISEGQFKEAQKELERRVNRDIGKEREKTVKLFFEFESAEKRDAVRVLLNKMRDERKDYDETFHYFVGCKIDKGRKDVGLEIIFNKNIPGLQEKMEKLLAEYHDSPKEEYETLNDQPVPERTKING